EAVTKSWKRRGIYDVLRNLYDHVLIYGSPSVFDPVSAYRFPDDLRGKTVFLNYVTDAGDIEARTPAPGDLLEGSPDEPLVVVTIGGGDGAGETVIGSYLDMLREAGSRVDFRSVILTGPFLSLELAHKFRQAARGLPATLHEFVPSTSPFLKSADLVVSTAGYNTISQTLAHAKRALVIPRIMHRKEQLMRAKRLARMGLIRFLHPDDISPQALFEEVKTLLADRAEPLAEGRERDLIRLDGAERLAAFCGRLHVPSSHLQEAAE
ncbi:MAG: glycosyltransferase family protein, partial [Candidatus Krumholzibacteriia bacterium]